MKEPDEIRCPKFRQKEPALEKITQEINQAQGQEKLRWAKRLETEVEPLLICRDYDSKSLECQSCCLIAQTRKKVAETMIKVLGFSLR